MLSAVATQAGNSRDRSSAPLVSERFMSVREAPASLGQRLLWLLEQYRPGTATLNCPVVCQLDGPLDVARLRGAIAGLVARHEALRTTVERRGRRLWQVVHKDAPAPLELIDLAAASDAPAATVDALHRELCRPLAIDGFPVRATLWSTAPDRHLFCLNVHHVASDAWSGAIRPDARSASAHCAGDGVTLPSSPSSVDFTALQEAYVAGPAFERDLAYCGRAALADAGIDAVPLAPAAGRYPRNGP